MLNEFNENKRQALIPDGANIRRWIEAKLSESNDQAIVEYLRRLHPTQAEQGYEQLRHLVERQEIRIGSSTYITRYFAVPILLETELPLSDEDTARIDPQAFLRSFHKLGLMGKKDGVVLINTLVGHDYIDTCSPSTLYNQAQSIFMSSVAGTGYASHTEKPVSSIQTVDGYLTLCFLVGVAHWKQGKDVPKMFSGSPDACNEWKSYATKVASFAMQTHELLVPKISIGEPQPIFTAFARGQWALAEAAISDICNEYLDMGVNVEASIQVSSDPWSPARNRIAVEIDPIRAEVPGGAFEIGVDEIKGMSAASFIGNVNSLMESMGVAIKSKGYVSVEKDGFSRSGATH